jgi:hypothetical protein
MECIGCKHAENQYKKIKEHIIVYNRFERAIRVNNQIVHGHSHTSVECEKNGEIKIMCYNSCWPTYYLKKNVNKASFDSSSKDLYSYIVVERILGDDISKLYIGFWWRRTGLINE